MLKLNNNELITIAARLGQGKSTFALSLANHYANKNYKILYCSLEMEKSFLEQRLSNSNGKITILDDYEQSVTTINKWLQEEQNKRKFYNVIIIDQANLLNEKINQVSRKLKLLARKYCFTIILLHQLNRTGANKSIDELGDWMLSGSDRIAQDADQIWLIDNEYIKVIKDRKNNEKFKYSYHFNEQTKLIDWDSIKIANNDNDIFSDLFKNYKCKYNIDKEDFEEETKPEKQDFEEGGSFEDWLVWQNWIFGPP